MGGWINSLKWIAAGLKTASPVLEATTRIGVKLATNNIGDRIVLGAAGGAAANAFLGDKKKPLTERLKRGALWGAGAGAFVGLTSRVAGMAGEGVYKGVKYAVPTGGKSLGKYAAGRVAAFRGGAGYYRSFGTYPVFMAGGAALGAYMSPDSRMKGAAIGAMGGAGIKTLAEVGMFYNKASFPVRAGMLAAGTVGAFGIASALQEPPTSAETPSYEETTQGSMLDRVRSINAQGGIVLGAHRGRH